MDFVEEVVELSGNTMCAEPPYGRVMPNETTGEYSNLGKRYVEYDENGNLVNANVDTNDHALGEVQSVDVFIVRVWDKNGKTANEEMMLCAA